jgi:hypothetical protein
VFNNNEKVNIVRRVLLGLDAAGVDTILTMPDAFNICWKAQDNLKLAATVRELDMLVESNQSDTVRAAAQMCDQGVDCIVSLGGDGTNRALAKACGAVPLLPLSTGTNNVFPYMLEGTLAGLAAGIVARGVVTSPEATRKAPRNDCKGSVPARWARRPSKCSRGSVTTRSNSAIMVAFGSVGSSASGRSAASWPSVSRHRLALWRWPAICP